MISLGVRRALLVLLVACRGSTDAGPDAMPDAMGTYPPPRTDAFMKIGSADTLEIAAWNIENYPARNTTPARVADLIASMDLDVIVTEEIASETAWKELMARLPDHEGILSEHRYTPTDYQKIGIIYKPALVTPSKIELLFTAETYPFPRPPFSASLAISDGTHAPLSIQVIGVHLKAGVAQEDGDRRRIALEKIDGYVRAQAAAGQEDEIVIAGDYNEVLNTTVGQTNFAPLLSAPDLYTIHTKAAAEAGEVSFIPASIMLDHIVTTAPLADEVAGAQLVIPRLQTLPQYTSEVSDHLPVVLVAPLR